MSEEAARASPVLALRRVGRLLGVRRNLREATRKLRTKCLKSSIQHGKVMKICARGMILGARVVERERR